MARKKKPTLPENVKMISVDLIKPYWRNPRRVPEDAVDALVDSISRYGYQQPVVVDEHDVIIIGHTRYAALRKMGVKEVPVLVADLSPEKAKQLRVIDNRTSEFTSWDYELLVRELGDFEEDLRLAYFPEISTEALDETLEFDRDLIARPTAPQWNDTTEQEWSEVEDEVEFVCPSCWHSFEMTVTKEALLTGRLEQKGERA